MAMIKLNANIIIIIYILTPIIIIIICVWYSHSDAWNGFGKRGMAELLSAVNNQ